MSYDTAPAPVFKGLPSLLEGFARIFLPKTCLLHSYFLFLQEQIKDIIIIFNIKSRTITESETGSSSPCARQRDSTYCVLPPRGCSSILPRVVLIAGRMTLQAPWRSPGVYRNLEPSGTGARIMPLARDPRTPPLPIARHDFRRRFDGGHEADRRWIQG